MIFGNVKYKFFKILINCFIIMNKIHKNIIWIKNILNKYIMNIIKMFLQNKFNLLLQFNQEKILHNMKY